MSSSDAPSPSERFADAPRHDSSNLRRVRCLNPFRWLEVTDGGVVTPCCSPWFKGEVGNITEQPLEAIWNGPAMRAVREAMFDEERWRECCNADVCPQILNDTWAYVDALTPEAPDVVAPITEEMLAEVRDGHTELAIPPAQIGISCDSRCNLRCIMCRTHDDPTRGDEVTRAALDQIRGLLPGVRRIKLMGNGEVFATREAREFLFSFDSAACPDTSFLIHTNGMLLTPEMWRRIEHIRMDWVVVSIDAATQETYERIRRGGEWNILMRNLEFLAEKHREGRINAFHLSFCVMRSNHCEMVAFAELGTRLGVTSTDFAPILGDYGDEQIFERRDIGPLRRVAEQLRHPLIAGPDCNASPLAPWRDWRPGARDYARALKRRVGRWVGNQ